MVLAASAGGLSTLSTRTRSLASLPGTCWKPAISPNKGAHLGGLAGHPFTHHEALHFDHPRAGTALGGHFQRGGAAHPGAHALVQLRVPLKARGAFAAMGIDIVADQGQGLDAAFTRGHEAGWGRVQQAAVGKGAGRRFTGHLATHGGVFAGADLRHGSAADEQAQEGEQAGQACWAGGVFFHEIFKGCGHEPHTLEQGVMPRQFTKNRFIDLLI